MDQIAIIKIKVIYAQIGIDYYFIDLKSSNINVIQYGLI
jgi:hypothetical protein